MPDFDRKKTSKTSVRCVLAHIEIRDFDHHPRLTFFLKQEENILIA